MIGLKEQTVRGAKSIAELRAKHKWNVPADYSVVIDCLDRHTELRDKVALLYEDDEGHTARYTFAQMIEASNRFANALRGIGINRGDVVAIHTPQRPETAIIHMALYRIGAIGLPISKLFGPDAIQYRLENSSAKAILMEPETVGKLEGVRDKVETLKHVIVCGGKAAGLPGGGKLDGLYPPTALKTLREIKQPRDKFTKLKLRCIVSGAEPVSPELSRWVDEELKVGFNQGFGQTEANYFIGTCGALESYKLEPLGKPYPGHRVAVIDLEGVPVKNGEVGE